MTIPSNVTSIGLYAFDACAGLISITIPSSVTSIGNYAFRACSGLESITVDKSNTMYDSRENCNAIIDTKNDILMFGCKNTKIPDNIKIIGEYAFEMCRSIT